MLRLLLLWACSAIRLLNLMRSCFIAAATALDQRLAGKGENYTARLTAAAAGLCGLLIPAVVAAAVEGKRFKGRVRGFSPTGRGTAQEATRENGT